MAGGGGGGGGGGGRPAAPFADFKLRGGHAEPTTAALPFAGKGAMESPRTSWLPPCACLTSTAALCPRRENRVLHMHGTSLLFQITLTADPECVRRLSALRLAWRITLTVSAPPPIASCARILAVDQSGLKEGVAG